MAWHDDSWRDSYGSWKLASPDDEYPQYECEQEDYDIDTIEGRCHSHRCGDSWYATEEEIISAIDSESVYARYVDELNHRQWWRDLFAQLTLSDPLAYIPPAGARMAAQGEQRTI